MLAKSKGFTIVELLIVIVVIGILAAIVIVAFNGVQMQARNANTSATIQAYKKALTQYAINNQSYPITGASCLGEDYPDTTDYSAATSKNCFRTNSGVLMNATFNTRLKPLMGGKLPTPNNTIFGSGSSPWSVRGAIMHTATGLIVNGVPNPWVLIYTMEGETKCPIGPIADVSTYPNTNGSPPAAGYSALISGGTVGVECWLMMPDPAKL